MALDQTRLPYVTLQTTKNPGLSDEYKTEMRIPLFDKNGSPFVWLDTHWVAGQTKKGSIVDYGNFDIRKTDGTRFQELIDVEDQIKALAASGVQTEKAKKENEDLIRQRESHLKRIDELETIVKQTAGGADLRTKEESDAQQHAIIPATQEPTKKANAKSA